MKYLLPELSYAYDSLEPFIDAATMEIHHSRHHQTYINNLNTVLEKYPRFSNNSVEELLKDWNNLEMEEKDKLFFKNNAGGSLNHSFFWSIMGPVKKIDEKLTGDIRREFGSLEEFRKHFTEVSVKHFASGWSWLVRDEKEALKIYSLPNQDSPLSLGHRPLIALDLWEHAYYLKYQNRRAEYIENWWNVLKLI